MNNSYSIRSLSIPNPESILYIGNGRTLTVTKSGIDLVGTIVVNPDDTCCSASTIVLAKDAAISGSGTISLGGRQSHAIITTTNSGTDTASLGAGIVIDGVGTLGGVLNSQASIEGGAIYPGPVIDGTVYQSGPGRLYVAVGGRSASIGAGTLVGGQIETLGGGVVNAIGRPSKISGVQITPNSTLHVREDSTLRVLSGGLVNDGTIVVDPTPNCCDQTNLELTLGAVVSGTGTVVLGSLTHASITTTSTNTDLATIAGGQVITGNGAIAGNVSCDGTIAPGVSIGRIDCAGGISMGATGVIEIDLASASSRDSIQGSGGLELGGKLRVRFLNNYQLPFNQKYTMISVGTRTGEFDTIELPPNGQLPGKLAIRYVGNTVVLGRYCPADVNWDGFVNGDDYDAFAELFDIADPAADFNADGFVNGNDYDEFADHFDTGC
ncbi:MAG: hypothetical protein U0638_09140 [Phycisphaerales bacterium]